MAPLMRALRILMVTVAVCGAGARARAGGLALESNAGPRDKASASLLRPIFEELARRGYRSGYPDVGKPLEGAVSRPSRSEQGLPADFPARVEQGYRLWLAGDFQGALAALTPLVQQARANAADVVGAAKVAAALLKAHVGIAMCHHRLGDDTAAWAAMAEIVRSFEAEVTKGQFGSEAYALYQQVKKEARAAAPGSLNVRLTDEVGVVFLNERFAKAGSGLRTDLVPGTYRVMAQLGPDFGRVYEVEIKAGGTAEVALDPKLERSLVTSPDWTGFTFRDRGEREQYEVERAAAVGVAVNEIGVVLVGTDQRKGRAIAYAALVNSSTGKEVRRASVVVDTLPPASRLHALARFVVGDSSAVDGLEVHKVNARPRQPSGAAAAEEEPSRWTGRRKVAAGVAVAGLGAAVAGFVFARQAQGFEDDAYALCPSSQQGCAESDRAEALLDRGHTRSLLSGVSYGVAAAAVVGAAVLWLTGAPSDEDSSEVARVRPRVGPGSMGGAVAGVELWGRF